MNRSKRIVVSRLWRRSVSPRPGSSQQSFLLLPLDCFLGRHLAAHPWRHEAPTDPEALSWDCSPFPPSAHPPCDVPSYMSQQVRAPNHASLHPVPNSAGSKTTPVSVKLWESPGRAGGLPLLLKTPMTQTPGALVCSVPVGAGSRAGPSQRATTGGCRYGVTTNKPRAMLVLAQACFFRIRRDGHVHQARTQCGKGLRTPAAAPERASRRTWIKSLRAGVAN